MVIKQIRRVSFWDKDNVNSLLSGLCVAPGTAEYEEIDKQPTSSPSQDYCAIGLPMFTPTQPSTIVEMKCSHCKASFTSRQEQVEHYRLDWHRCNLQRSIAGKTPLTEEQFVNDISDVSSISGSEDENSGDDDDDEEEEEEDDDAVRSTQDDDASIHVLKRQARMFFLNADGLVISLYRTVLFNKKCQMEGEQDAVQRVQAVTGRQMWAVILLGGGHFAAAVFNGNDVVIHKTFHNYTVRAKQGGNQGSKDNQSGTSHPKSGGASLRRYNEMSQKQHIQELMSSWKPHLARCNLVFYHAKHHNRNTLFSGKNAILDSTDTRLRTIPFPTKRAKFSEVKRVFETLSEILVHGTEEEFRSMVRESNDKEVKPVVKKESPVKKPVRKPKSERKETVALSSTSGDSEEDSESDLILMTSTMTFDTSDLGGEGGACSLNLDKRRRQRRKKMAGKHTSANSGDLKGNNHKTKMYDILYTACKVGNLDHLAILLKKPLTHPSEGNALSKEVMDLVENDGLPKQLSKITFGKQSRTMLHIATENNQKDAIWWLMDHGCDPSVSDSQGFVPYNSTDCKNTHNVFRRFMAQHPLKYNYEKAKIPSPLTPEQEAEQAAILARRKKIKRQTQQAKRKKKQQEEKEKKMEEEDKRRFLNLSDREKRALAAERRLLQQSEEAGEPLKVLQRCFFCAGNITGMVPFEYNDFKFCSTKCVREHRTKKT